MLANCYWRFNFDIFGIENCIVKVVNLINERPIRTKVCDPNEGTYLCSNDLLLVCGFLRCKWMNSVFHDLDGRLFNRWSILSGGGGLGIIFLLILSGRNGILAGGI